MVENTLDQIHAVTALAARISLADARAVLDEFGRTHSLMPILDPTGYKRIMPNMDGHETIVRAFVAFRYAIEKAIEEEAK